LHRVVGSRDEAEDLVQETFARLHDRPPTSLDELSVRVWLYRVATNLAYNHLRARARRQRRDREAAARGTAVGDAPPGPEASAVSGAEIELVRRALAGLPDRQSKLLLLRHAGLSYAEVAAAVGVAAGSVGTLLSRAESAFELEFRSLTEVEARAEAAAKAGAPTPSGATLEPARASDAPTPLRWEGP
ncbi:MAG: RNA polymerase sigma factor, partial [Anaerolineae bacterium]